MAEVAGERMIGFLQKVQTNTQLGEYLCIVLFSGGADRSTHGWFCSQNG